MLRSPYYYYSNGFCGVNATGAANYNGARNSYGVAPAFSF